MLSDAEKTDDEQASTDVVLMFLNEAISFGRKAGYSGQQLSAMCDARDELMRLRGLIVDFVDAEEAVDREGERAEREGRRVSTVPIMRRLQAVRAMRAVLNRPEDPWTALADPAPSAAPGGAERADAAPEMGGLREVTVTLTRNYLVPMRDATHSVINGWTPAEVARDWFDECPLSRAHATRDTHAVGYSERVVGVRIEARNLTEAASDAAPVGAAVAEARDLETGLRKAAEIYRRQDIGLLLGRAAEALADQRVLLDWCAANLPAEVFDALRRLSAVAPPARRG